MLGQTYTCLVGSDASALFFEAKNENLNAEEIYSKWSIPIFGKGVAYDVPNPVCLGLLSGAGTNLKVGGTVPQRKWGSPIRREVLKENFGRVPPIFGFKMQLVVLVSAFMMVSI